MDSLIRVPHLWPGIGTSVLAPEHLLFVIPNRLRSHAELHFLLSCQTHHHHPFYQVVFRSRAVVNPACWNSQPLLPQCQALHSSAQTPTEHANCSLSFSEDISRVDAVNGGTSLENLFVFSNSSLCFGARGAKHKGAEVKRAGITRGIQSKRNNTIGLGEFEQLDLMVTESVIRWASCTHLPTAPSLKSSC